MPRTKIVYEGGRLDHLSSEALYDCIAVLDARNASIFHPSERWEISDRAAQTIAAMWHSPGNPNSTMLSTMGMVSETTCLGDFCTEYEYLAATPEDTRFLDYLDSYIKSKQELG